MTDLECRVCGDEILDPNVGHGIACSMCWRRVPVRMRMALVIAYRHRREAVGRYREVQAGVLQWCADQRAGMRRKVG